MISDYDMAIGMAITSYGKAIASYDRAITSYGKAITGYDRAITSYGTAITGYDRAITSYGTAGPYLVTTGPSLVMARP